MGHFNQIVNGDDQSQKLESAVRSPLIARTNIVIDGYADALDSSGHNLGLSQRRAEAVMDVEV
jgi:outer membrane protein OmpA-like peptidoglycan-associated protein